jgi:hypothetical protein
VFLVKVYLKDINNEKILTPTLGLLLVFSVTIQKGKLYEGSSALKLLIGNTLEANHINVDECKRHVFYEHYDKDSKLCTSVYGRPYSRTLTKS